VELAPFSQPAVVVWSLVHFLSRGGKEEDFILCDTFKGYSIYKVVIDVNASTLL
jgi:hypothetical protein